MVELHTPDGPMSATECKPTGEVKGAVLVIQEAFGLTDHIANVCQRFANEGYVAIAPAMYHRQGSPIVDYNDMKAAMAVLNKLTCEDVRADTNAALSYLNQQGFADENIGVVGFCIGGVFSFYASTSHKLGAAATFYGTLGQGRVGFAPVIEQVPTMKTPWIGFFGDQDQGIPTDDVEQMKVAVKSVTVPTEIHRYAEAGHGFHCDARPANYDESAAKDAWSKTIAWFNRHIKPPVS
jgi:carboxymethylenebutenolidase